MLGCFDPGKLFVCFFLFFSTSVVQRHSMLPICPAVLEHEDAESLFKALQDKHPVDIFRHLTATSIIPYFMHLCIYLCVAMY